MSFFIVLGRLHMCVVLRSVLHKIINTSCDGFFLRRPKDEGWGVLSLEKCRNRLYRHCPENENCLILGKVAI